LHVDHVILHGHYFGGAKDMYVCRRNNTQQGSYFNMSCQLTNLKLVSSCHARDS